MSNGGFPVGSASIDIGVNLAPLTAELQRAEQLTESIAANIDGTMTRGATGAATALGHLGSAAITTQNQIARLDATIQNQAQELALAERQLERAALRYGENSVAVQKNQLAVDKLNRSLQLNGEMLVQAENKLREYESTSNKIGQSAGKSGGIFSSISGALGGIGAVAGGIGLAASVQQVAQLANEGNKLVVTMDTERRTLGALLGDVDRGNTVYAQAIAFGQKYGYTQEEMGKAAQEAALLIRNGNSSVEQTLDVLARLQAKNPEKSFQDAVRAVTELQAGQFQSLERIFNIPAAAVQGLSDKIKAGADPIRELDGLLNQMGITNDILKTRTEGATGAQNALNVSVENFKLALGGLVQSSGWTQFLKFWADLGTGVLGGKGLLSSLEDQAKADVASMIDSSNTVAELQQKIAQRQAQLDDQLLAARTKRDSQEALRIAALKGSYNDQQLPANDDALNLIKQADAHERNAAAAEKNAAALNKVTVAGQEHVLTVEEQIKDIDKLTAALQAATNQGLRPYQAAVDAAKTSLDQHQKTTAAAKDTVDSISNALTKAKATYSEFASARLAEDEKYRKGLIDLDLRQSQAEQRLADFKAPGAGLDQLLNPIQAQIDAGEAALKGYKQNVDDATNAVDAQSRVVDAATAAQKAYDDAVSTAKDNLSSQQDRLTALQGVYDNLGESIKSAQHDMEALRHTALVGEGALSDQLFAMEQRIKQQQLRIDEMRLRGANKKDIEAAQKELDRLRTMEEAAQLRGQIKYDPQHRALEQQGVDRNEQTFDKASHDIGQYQKGIESLTKAQQDAGQAVEDQKTVVRDAMFDVMDAAAAQRDHAVAVTEAKTALDKLKDVQAAANKQFSDEKQLIADLHDQYNTTKDKALKPFQDQIDDLGRQASALKLAEKMEIGPLQRKIEDLTTKTKLLTFQEIIDGLNNTNDVIKILEPRLDHANVILKAEQDATKAAQVTYDAATAALTAEQKYFDAMKTGLEDMKNNLQAIKDGYPDLAALAQLINTVNGGTAIPGQRAPFTGQTGATGAGGYDVGAVDTLVGASGLKGQGALLVQLSQQYGIPLPLALAMLKHESSWNSMGASVANNNPGNLKYTETTAGYGGTPGTAASDGGVFAHFKSVQEGLAAYFHLLQDVYGKFIASGDIAGLIGKYAPSSSNDTAGYIAIVQQLIAQYAAAIVQKAAAKSFSRGSVSEATAAGVPDPVLSDQAIDAVLPGGHQTGSYHGDRLEMATATNPKGVDLHQGLDLAGTAGMDVKAPHGGHVVFAGPNKYGGTAVIIENDAGEQWYFGHLRGDINVGVGDNVTAGQIIGHINPDYNHVHVQEKVNGQLVDPTTTLEELAGATGAGPGADDLSTLLAYVQAMQKAGATYDDLYPKLPKLTDGVTDLLPNLDDLIKAVQGVGDAATDTAAGIVNATDDILNHATYKNRDGSGQLAYINQNGGLSGDHGDWTRTGGGGMSVGGPHFGDPIATGTGAGMGFGDGWSKGIEDITPQIEDTTTTTLQQLQDDVLTPWQDNTRDFFSGAGFGFIGAASEGINSAGGGLAESAGRVGGAAGASFVGSLKGNLGGIAEAVASINAALSQITTDITATVHVQYDDPGRPTGSTTQTNLTRRMGYG